MAILKDVTLTGINANSYIDSDMADDLATTVYNSSWLTAKDVDGFSDNAILITSALMLNNVDYSGQRVNERQVLAFPRMGLYTRNNVSFTYDSSVPQEVMYAQFMLAEHLLNNPNILKDKSTIDSLSVSGVGLNAIKLAPKIPASVLKILSPYRDTSNIVWRSS